MLVCTARLGHALLLVTAACITTQPSFAQSTTDSSDNLGVAEYTDADELHYPDDTDRWIVLGTNIGGDYSDAEFDPQNPGMIGVVQIEPKAYQYLLDNREYANGTMLLLTFYRPQAKPQPDLSGFVQGDVAGREIHVIDRKKFQDERGFYLFGAEGAATSTVLPPGNECVQCHAEHGAFDSTFIQFYPTIRDLVTSASD